MAVNINPEDLKKKTKKMTYWIIIIVLLIISAVLIPKYMEIKQENEFALNCIDASSILTKAYLNIQEDVLDKDLINLNWNSPEDVLRELARSINLYTIQGNTSSAKLKNGMIIEIVAVSDDCTAERGNTEMLKSVCATATIDVNGAKKPNENGFDTFYFYLTRYGVVPAGSVNDTYAPLSECRETGVGCTAWAITKGDLRYRRHDLKWE